MVSIKELGKNSIGPIAAYSAYSHGKFEQMKGEIKCYNCLVWKREHPVTHAGKPRPLMHENRSEYR